MNEKQTGGTAFPQCSYNMKGGYDITGGLSIRDYFAAKAMQIYLSDVRNHSYQDIAEYSYEMADAMLEVRK